MRLPRDGRGRPRHEARRPGRPPHHRGLPLRQGVRLPGARLLARAPAASADPHRRQGRGRVPPGDLGRGARRRRRRASRGRSSGTARSRCCPTRTSARWACCRAARWPTGSWRRSAHRSLVRTICASAGADRRRHRHGPVARGRSRGVAAGEADRLLGLEPDVDGAAPVAPDHARAPRRREAGRRRPVPQPHGARRRPAPDAAARHRRRPGARDPPGAARRRPRRRGVVPRERRRLRRAGRTARRLPGRSLRRPLRHRERRDPRAGARDRHGAAVADPPRRRRAASRRRADRVPHGGMHPGPRRLVAASRRRAVVHPAAATNALDTGVLQRPALQRAHAAVAQHVAARRGPDRPRLWRRP